MLWEHGDEMCIFDFGLLASRLNENKCVVLAPPGLEHFVLVAYKQIYLQPRGQFCSDPYSQ